MVYVITSEDYAYFQKEKEAIQKAKNLSNEHVIDDVLFIEQAIDQFGQESFFETPKHLIVFKYIFDAVEPDYFTQIVELLVRLGHTVIVYEYALSKELKSFVTAKQASHLEQKPKAKAVASMPFEFTDFYLNRDKKNAWITLSRLMDGGMQGAQVGAGLHWALKTLYLAKTSTQAQNPDIKPYTWNKTQRVVSKWSEGEIRQSIHELLFVSAEEQFDEEGFRMKLEQMVFAL